MVSLCSKILQQIFYEFCSSVQNEEPSLIHASRNQRVYPGEEAGLLYAASCYFIQVILVYRQAWVMQFFYFLQYFSKVHVHFNTTHIQPGTHDLFHHGATEFRMPFSICFSSGGFMFGQQVDSIIEAAVIDSWRIFQKKVFSMLSLEPDHSFAEPVKKTAEYFQW